MAERMVCELEPPAKVNVRRWEMKEKKEKREGDVFYCQ